jgi:cobalamin biosynthesis protein CobT
MGWSLVWAQDDEFKDAIRAIVATSPRGRAKRQRHAKVTTKKAARREEDVAGSDAQCLVRWKDTWEPAANLSLSCLARWDAEQQERERRTATTTTTTTTTATATATTTTPRKRGRPKGVKNKAASPLRPRAKKNEERRTRVGKRKREDDEDSEEENENENENEEEEGEEEEEKNEEREEEHEEEEEEEEEARVRVAREGLGASPLLAHNFERLRKRKRSRLKDSLTLPTRQPDLPPPPPGGRDEEAEADEEQQLDGVFDHPAGFAPAWFPHTVHCFF